jgi:hypothetical protein
VAEHLEQKLKQEKTQKGKQAARYSNEAYAVFATIKIKRRRELRLKYHGFRMLLQDQTLYLTSL